MSGGGKSKSDKQEATIKLPPEIEALAKRNLNAAERAGQIGYIPYQGPTVAALNPMQTGAMESNYSAMNAFGVPGAVDPSSAIPEPTTYAGGVQGYDPIGLYLQSLSRIHPGQREQIASFVSPASRAATMANTVGQLRGTDKPRETSGSGASSSSAPKPKAPTYGAPGSQVAGQTVNKAGRVVVKEKVWDWGLNGGAGGYKTVPRSVKASTVAKPKQAREIQAAARAAGKPSGLVKVWDPNLKGAGKGGFRMPTPYEGRQAKPVTKPVAKAVAKPVTKPVAKPKAKPAAAAASRVKAARPAPQKMAKIWDPNLKGAGRGGWRLPTARESRKRR